MRLLALPAELYPQIMCAVSRLLDYYISCISKCQQENEKIFHPFFTGSFSALTGVFQFEGSPVSFQFPQNGTILPQLISNRATKIFVDRSRHCATDRRIQRLPRLTNPFRCENKVPLSDLHPATPGTHQPCPQIACKAVFPAPDSQQCNYTGKGNRPHRHPGGSQHQ